MSMILAVTAIIAVLGATVFAVTKVISRKPKWDPRGKHCYVTGGSAGLGLALATLLAERGAHVSIVARDKKRLDEALQRVEAARQSSDQIFKAYSFAIDQCKEAEAALEASTVPHGGKCPEAFFLCAGKSRPGFFIEQSEESMILTMQETYWAQAWTALAASKRMVRDGVKGKICFVASVLAYMSMIGYSPYSPGKFAVRGLADCLESELILYGIDVHICFPGTIHSPGFVEENLVKPKITLQIEERDEGLTPEDVAKNLLRGVENHKFHITYDFIGHIFRSITRGAAPGNSGLLEFVYTVIGTFGVPQWRGEVDARVRAHKEEHQQYLKDKGFLKK